MFDITKWIHGIQKQIFFYFVILEDYFFIVEIYLLTYENEFLILKIWHIFHIRNPLSFSKKKIILQNHFLNKRYLF